MESRACSTCGGRVDVMTVPDELENGQSVPMRVGACERCGTLFTDTSVSELSDPPDDEHEETP